MKNCLVFGCGRSGTSLFMSLIRNSGFYMGENLYLGTEANPNGYFESPEINEINEELLASVLPYRFSPLESPFIKMPFLGHLLGMLDYNKHIPIHGQRWLASIQEEIFFPQNDGISQKIDLLVKRTPFCFKDPRFLYTHPYWLKYLDHKSIMFIVVFRHPTSTVKSILKEMRNAPYLRNRLSMSHKEIHNLWSSYYKRVLEIAKQPNVNWIFVHYEQILNHSILTKLERTLGLEIDASHINNKLYRSKPEGDISRKQLRIYEKLCERSHFIY